MEKIFENKFNYTEEDIRKTLSAMEKDYKKHLKEIKSNYDEEITKLKAEYSLVDKFKLEQTSFLQFLRAKFSV